MLRHVSVHGYVRAALRAQTSAHAGGVDRIARWVNEMGGLAQKQQLVARGATDRALAAAVHSGAVVRARQGWYSTFAEDAPALRAARVGGRLTGMSALLERGAWSWTGHPLHVSVSREASRLRTQWDRFRLLSVADPGGVVLHWDDSAVAARGSHTAVALEDALLAAVQTEPFETCIAVLDWALRSGALDRFAFERLILSLPSEARMIAHWVDPLCDSVLESVARTWLQLAGYRVASQVPVGMLERIDLVVESVVALELGGRTHDETRESDWRKNATITREGFHPVLATYSMVRDDFPTVLSTIDAALAARRDPADHVANSGSRDIRSRRGRKLWRLLDGSTTRIPEFPTGGPGSGAGASARASATASARTSAVG